MQRYLGEIGAAGEVAKNFYIVFRYLPVCADIR
jgi:hypothetical protein